MTEKTLQVLGNLFHVRVTRGGVEPDAPVDDRGQVGLGTLQRRERHGTDAVDQFLRVSLLKRGGMRHELVKRDAERILVPGKGVDPVREAFRRHVAQRPAPHVLRLPLPCGILQDERQPEVPDMDLPVRVEQQVRRLHVAVQDAAAVGIGESTGGLKPQTCSLARGAFAIMVQPLAVDELHRVIAPVGADARVVDLDDVRMVEHRDHACLVLEPFPLRRIGRQGGRQQLHRDFPVQRHL